MKNNNANYLFFNFYLQKIENINILCNKPNIYKQNESRKF
uniref:Uncharacterized protein n=1 Tax=viral metagenome TaxID=1070528 RepID=A0A6C0DZB8_9ZZZZ